MNRLFLVLLIFPLIFTSCEKDGENQNNNNLSESIIGTWKLDGVHNTYDYGYIDPTSGNEIITSTEEVFGPEEGYEGYLTFTDDNYVFTYDYINDTLDYEYTYVYNLNGNIIEIIDGQDTSRVTITELTDTYLNYTYTIYSTNTEGDTTFFYNDYTDLTCVKSSLPSLHDHDPHKNKSDRKNHYFF